MHKYEDINVNNFNSNLIKAHDTDLNSKFNIKYNDKLMRITSLIVCESYGLKKIGNIYKISCIFNDLKFKNMFIDIYKRIKEIFTDNTEINIKHPFGNDNNKAIDFTIDKYTSIFNVTFNNILIHNYNNIDFFLYKDVTILPVIYFNVVEIKNETVYLNFNLSEIYINVKCKYSLQEVKKLFNEENLELKKDEKNSKSSLKQYKINN